MQEIWSTIGFQLTEKFGIGFILSI